MRLVTISLVIAAIVVTGSPAHADNRQARAEALWEEGAARYDVGKWEEAATLFMQAYELYPEPDILFNLCQAHRQMRHYDKAVFYCKSFLRNKPSAKNRREVEELIVQMDTLAKSQEENDQRPPEGIERPFRPANIRAGGVADTPRTLEPWYTDGWGWGVAATGGALTILGGGAFIWASALDDDAHDTMDADDATRLHEQAESRRTFGTISTIVGAAALIGGVVILAYNPATHADSTATHVAVGFGWVSLEGTF